MKIGCVCENDEEEMEKGRRKRRRGGGIYIMERSAPFACVEVSRGKDLQDGSLPGSLRLHTSGNGLPFLSRYEKPPAPVMV